jgi:hypothetical protein
MPRPPATCEKPRSGEIDLVLAAKTAGLLLDPSRLRLPRGKGYLPQQNGSRRPRRSNPVSRSLKCSGRFDLRSAAAVADDGLSAQNFRELGGRWHEPAPGALGTRLRDLVDQLTHVTRLLLRRGCE